MIPEMTALLMTLQRKGLSPNKVEKLRLKPRHGDSKDTSNDHRPHSPTHGQHRHGAEHYKEEYYTAKPGTGHDRNPTNFEKNLPPVRLSSLARQVTSRDSQEIYNSKEPFISNKDPTSHGSKNKVQTTPEVNTSQDTNKGKNVIKL